MAALGETMPRRRAQRGAGRAGRRAAAVVLGAALACYAGIAFQFPSWSSPEKTPRPDAASRRSLLSASLGLGAAAGIVAASPAPVSALDSSILAGLYDDPQHPGCLRMLLEESSSVLKVDGRDGKPKCKGLRKPDGSMAKPWTGKVTITEGNKVTVDLSKKGGPSDVVAIWDGEGLLFPDGNKWKKKGADNADILGTPSLKDLFGINAGEAQGASAVR
eukprot:TRINITY_DN104419_c0_g1_i1.p1 TRINITY_DN104419_c0_g1~~TRINITY_DN104419_c0_g1_i1.p1  ORF type:complete len:218 (-),score=45.87 TRINITY_DN104419_c0_g1_i1:71-724(-)